MRNTSPPIWAGVGRAAWLHAHGWLPSGMKTRPSRHHDMTRSQLSETMARHRGSFRSSRRDYREIRLVFQHQRARSQHALLSDRDMIADGNVDADEAALPDANAARDHHVRRQEDVILDHRMVADMIAAPQRHIGANGGQGLDGIVLEDEAILLRLEARKDCRTTADIGCDAIAHRPRGGDLLGSQGVDPGVTDGDEAAEPVRREFVDNFLERHNRPTA